MNKTKFSSYIAEDGTFHAQIQDVFIKVIMGKSTDPDGTITLEGECPRCEHWSFSANSCARERNLLKYSLPAFIKKLKETNVEACKVCKKIISIWADGVQIATSRR